MKKIIFLFAAVSFCIVAAQAQDARITKIFGRFTMPPPATPLVDLETDSMIYTSGTLNERTMHFSFEFTNGQTPLKRGDTIVIDGRIGAGSFMEDSFKYTLTADLGVGETVQIADQYGESFVSWASVFTKVNDTLTTGMIYGEILYISTQDGNPVSVDGSTKGVKAHFLKREPPISVVETTNMDKVKFYPNPVSSTLTVDNLRNTNVDIYSVIGQRILHFENVSGELTIPLTEYPEGIYFLKMQNGNTTRTEKIKVVR
ncbi:MAG: T9SS type A sorting domain-containing protein [Bacteroidales bacterium]|jgi:hypothetical protein|nr:T9SS type A sorting domain-containing protein [Bacteroidales bacterium]